MVRASRQVRPLFLRLKGFDPGWEVVPQQGSQLVGHLGAVPHGVLMGAGEDGDGLGQWCVGGQRAMGRGVGAQDVRQGHGVGVVGLGP